MKYVRLTTHKHLGDAVVTVGAVQQLVKRYSDFRFFFDSSFAEAVTKGVNGFVAEIPRGEKVIDVFATYGGVPLERIAKFGTFVQGYVYTLCSALRVPRFRAAKCELPIRPKYLDYPYILISPSVQRGSGECKRYPYWQEVVDNLIAKGWTVVHPGANNARDIVTDLDNVVDLRGKTTVDEFISLCQHASWIISTPSAAVHIGSSNDVPTIVINGGREPALLSKYAKTIHMPSQCPSYPLCDGINRGCLHFCLRHENVSRNCKAVCTIEGVDFATCQCLISPADITSHIPAFTDTDEPIQGEIQRSRIPVIIPLGSGSCDNDNELKICLRAMERNCRNLGEIYIATTNPPKWLDTSKVTIVPIHDKSQNKDANIIDKVIGTIKKHKIVGRWIFNTDDQIFLQECNLAKIPVVGDGRMKADLGDGLWYNRARATFDLMAKLKKPLSSHMDVHTPQPFDSSVVDLIKRIAYNKGNGYTICNLFYGLMQKTPEAMQADVKHTIQCAEDAAECDYSKMYLGFNDAGYKVIKDKLFELFPTKSRYEK